MMREVRLRLPEDVHEKLQKEAKALGLSPSLFLRVYCCEKYGVARPGLAYHPIAGTWPDAYLGEEADE